MSTARRRNRCSFMENLLCQFCERPWTARRDSRGIVGQAEICQSRHGQYNYQNVHSQQVRKERGVAGRRPRGENS